MKIQGLIDSLTKPAAAPAAPATTKTASEGVAPAVTTAIKAALSHIEQSKVASAPGGDVTSDLQKIAAETIAAEKTAEERHVHRLGEIMADGFASRLETYRAASEDLSKVAGSVDVSDVTPEEVQLIKMARNNPEAFMAEVERSYEAKLAEAQAEAKAAYEATYNNVVERIHKLASEHYVRGYQIVAELAAS